MRVERSEMPHRKRLYKSDSIDAMADSPVGSRSRGLELDLRLRDFEINQLTQRNNFFMIFQGVIIAGLVQSQGTAAPIINFLVSLLGIGTSILQIGMAGGAKYWQSRWESATRSSEIAIVLELVKKKRLAVQTFTLDQSSLSQSEKDEVSRWNIDNPNDPITDDGGFIHEQVLKDIQGDGKRKIRAALDFWVRKLVISQKWSVSRIPIWLGAFLLIFWLFVWLNTWSFSQINQQTKTDSGFRFVSLQNKEQSSSESKALERLSEATASLAAQSAEGQALAKRVEDELRRQLAGARASAPQAPKTGK